MARSERARRQKRPEAAGSAPDPRAQATAEIRIRPMRSTDLPEVARIEAASFSTPWSQRAFHSLLEDEAVLARVASREDDSGSAVVGYVILWVVADQAELANVAVAPTERGHGHGSALLAEAERLAGVGGAREIFLEARRSNDRALGLYDRRGYVQVGVRRAYYQKPREDALVMVKRLAVRQR